MAIPEIIVPKAFNKKKPGTVTIFTIKGPIKGINAINAPSPVKNWVKTPNEIVTKTIILSCQSLNRGEAVLVNMVVMSFSTEIPSTSKVLKTLLR